MPCPCPACVLPPPHLHPGTLHLHHQPHQVGPSHRWNPQNSWGTPMHTHVRTDTHPLQNPAQSELHYKGTGFIIIPRATYSPPGCHSPPNLEARRVLPAQALPQHPVMLGGRDAVDKGTFGGTVALSLSPPTRTHLVLLPEGRTGLVRTHRPPHRVPHPHPGAVCPRACSEARRGWFICALSSARSQPSPSPMDQLPDHPRRQPPAAPTGPRFLWGDLPWGPTGHPSSTPGRAGRWQPPHPPKFHCFDVFLKKRLRFGHRRAKPQDADGAGGVRAWEALCAAPPSQALP